jgi:hypothetical protein
MRRILSGEKFWTCPPCRWIYIETPNGIKYTKISWKAIEELNKKGHIYCVPEEAPANCINLNKEKYIDENGRWQIPDPGHWYMFSFNQKVNIRTIYQIKKEKKDGKQENA